MKTEANRKLIEKNIGWKETYTDKTEFLKEQFHDTIGPGSYFRFEGKSAIDDAEYYCIVSPARIHKPIAKWFAGVRKLPATYSAGGKYFDSLGEAFAYAAETWGIPKPKTMRPYSSGHLKGLSQKVERWKEKREESKKEVESFMNIKKIKTSQAYTSDINVIDRINQDISDIFVNTYQANNVGTGLGLFPPRTPSLETNASNNKVFNLYKYSMGTLSWASRTQSEFYDIKDVVSNWREIWSEHIENNPTVERTLQNGIIIMRKAFDSKKEDIRRQFRFSNELINTIYNGAVAYNPQYGLYLIAFGPYTGEKEEAQYKFGVFTMRLGGININVMKQSLESAINEFASKHNIELSPEDFGLDLQSFTEESYQLMKQEGNKNLAEKYSSSTEFYGDLSPNGARDLYENRHIPNQNTNLVLNNKGILKVLSKLSVHSKFNEIYESTLAQISQNLNISQEELINQIRNTSISPTEEENLIKQVLDDIKNRIQDPETLQSIQRDTSPESLMIGKLFDPSKDITQDKEYKKALEGKTLSRFSPLLSTPPYKAEVKAKNEFYKTYLNLSLRNGRKPSVEETREAFNNDPVKLATIREKIEKQISNTISQIRSSQSENVNFKKTYSAEVESFFEDIGGINSEENDESYIQHLENSIHEIEMLKPPEAISFYNEIQELENSGTDPEELYEKLSEQTRAQDFPRRGKGTEILPEITEKKAIVDQYKERFLHYFLFAKEIGIMPQDAELHDSNTASLMKFQMKNLKSIIKERNLNYKIQQVSNNSNFYRDFVNAKGKIVYPFQTNITSKSFYRVLSELRQDLTLEKAGRENEDINFESELLEKYKTRNTNNLTQVESEIINLVNANTINGGASFIAALKENPKQNPSKLLNEFGLTRLNDDEKTRLEDMSNYYVGRIATTSRPSIPITNLQHCLKFVKSFVTQGITDPSTKLKLIEDGFDPLSKVDRPLGLEIDFEDEDQEEIENKIRDYIHSNPNWRVSGSTVGLEEPENTDTETEPEETEELTESFEEDSEMQDLEGDQLLDESVEELETEDERSNEESLEDFENMEDFDFDDSESESITPEESDINETTEEIEEIETQEEQIHENEEEDIAENENEEEDEDDLLGFNFDDVFDNISFDIDDDN